MGEKPFIKFYPSDFLAGTSGLSPAERGVYITLLLLIYENDGPIKRDDGRLARRCGAPKAAFLRILGVLIDEGKVSDVDGFLTNKRAENAIMDRTNRSQIATHAANSRWAAQSEKTQRNQRADNSDAMLAQCSSVCQPEPEPEPDRGVNPSSSDLPSKPRKRRSKATPMPDDWAPDIAKAQSLMADLDLSREEMNYCFQRMKDHAHATDRRQVDWDRSFASWVRKAANDGEIGAGARSRRVAGRVATAFDF